MVNRQFSGGGEGRGDQNFFTERTKGCRLPSPFFLAIDANYGSLVIYQKSRFYFFAKYLSGVFYSTPFLRDYSLWLDNLSGEVCPGYLAQILLQGRH